MSDMARERTTFEARLRELRLEWLDTAEIQRLWQSRLKQIEVSNRLAAGLDPAAESALQLVVRKGDAD